MAKRPVPAPNSEKARALICAFAQVPGSSAIGVRTEQILQGFSNAIDVDALTLKGNNLTHIQRVGAARMLRVPVPDLLSGENSLARSPFQERLGAFQRALSRQLAADRYDVVFCLDLFAAAAASALTSPTKLVVEVVDVPSVSFDKRWPVEANDDVTRQNWDAAERAAFKAATLVLVPSRHAARLLSERADPRKLRVVPRFVDMRVFQPPSIELALDDVKTVAFLGGREGKSRSAVVAAAIQALVSRVPDVRVLVLGTPSRADHQLTNDLTRWGVAEQVVLVDIASPQDLAQALCAAHVVIVAAGTEGDIYALPHRALEAMACRRPVVLSGIESAYKDVIVPKTHALVVAAGNPDDIALAVAGLLADESGRNTLARAGFKQACQYDLQTMLPDLAVVLSEATGVTFTAQFPPEETTASSPLARAPSRPENKDPTKTVQSARAAPVADPSSLTLSSVDEAPGDDWAGDTVLDPDALPAVPSEALEGKAAMLFTQAGSAEPRSAPTTLESQPLPLARPARAASGLRSLQLAIADDSNDDWSSDTVADAAPVDATRPVVTGEPPRSLLVRAEGGDTAEDSSTTTSSSSD